METITEVAKLVETPSERFTKLVMREFTGSSEEVQVTNFQKRLIQNYFIKVDQTLKTSELKRLGKSKNQDSVPVTWDNLNISKLAIDVMSFSSVGLDAMQPNHINLIPYKNNGTGKYDMTFIIGYRGLELKAKKYGLDIPDDVIVELVYSTDKFKQIKKDLSNKIEGFIFEITDDFNRGDIIGGFYYHSFNDDPTKNKIRVFNLKDIEKRKPKYASAEFWGGTDYNGNKTDGWFELMAEKTICRSAWNSITIDSEKIDNHLISVLDNDSHDKALPTVEDAVATEVKENANSKLIDFSTFDDVLIETKVAEPVKAIRPAKELFETKAVATIEADF